MYMLNFNDFDLVKLKIKDIEFEKNKKIDIKKIKFFNSLYNKNDLSSYILVDKKQRKNKDTSKSTK